MKLLLLFDPVSCWPKLAVATLAAAVLAGCASGGHRAPVEDRPVSGRPSVAAAPAAQPSATLAAPVAPGSPADSSLTKPLPGTENAGKPGHYTVKPGDTLIRIGLENGQNWRDIARWSGLENPNIIEVGQVLRVVPPSADANGVVARPVAAAGRVESKPLDSRAGDAKPAGTVTAPAPAAGTAASNSAASGGPAAAGSGSVAPSSTPAAPAAVTRDPEDDLGWAWPAQGPVIASFDDVRSKGLAIGGKAGDPVLAAADGRVVYAGSGLRGYGNLVIVKHNATFLTAYAHNQALLVKEDQVVRRGQKIAEMGSSDAERVQLHFEIRRQGKPIDPARLLPTR
jgi:lipoprotein NlpD